MCVWVDLNLSGGYEMFKLWWSKKILYNAFSDSKHLFCTQIFSEMFRALNSPVRKDHFENP